MGSSHVLTPTRNGYATARKVPQNLNTETSSSAVGRIVQVKPSLAIWRARRNTVQLALLGLIRKQVLGLVACLVAWCSSIRHGRHHG